MRYVGAIDQGTTSTRFIVFDKRGAIKAVAQREHEQIFPRPGWVEHDAIEIWRNTRLVIRDALKEAGLAAKDLAAIGITNQRETTLVWDRATGKPLHNALVWQDTRVDALAARFAKDGGRDRFRAKTGLPLASYFAGLKLRWLLDNVKGLRKRAPPARCCSARWTRWIAWNLTGGVRRRAARHRRHQRQPHPAHEPEDARLGRRPAEGLRHPARHAAGDPLLVRGLRREPRRPSPACPSPASSATSRRRCSARPASSAARPRTPTARAPSC